MEYPKINSLYMREGRNEDGTFDKSIKEHLLMLGKHACEEFGAIKTWRVDEKIDGTNIRIYYNNVPTGDKTEPTVAFHGRTAHANIPSNLLNYLKDHFTIERLSKVFQNPGRYILYGEGFGPKIQACGSLYADNQRFILFDVVINNWWLKREDVQGLAQSFEIPSVPDLGLMTEEQIIEFVRSKPLSKISKDPLIIEGVVVRSHPLMLFRDGKPIMFKLKCKDIK